MKNTSVVIIGSVLSVLFGFGCAEQPRPRLDDHFTTGQMMSAGGRFYVAVDLAPGVSAATARRLLVQSLEGDSKGSATQYPPPEMTLMGLRRRDYWALVLAEITGVPIDIGFADPEEERETRIRQLLATVRAMGGRGATNDDANN